MAYLVQDADDAIEKFGLHPIMEACAKYYDAAFERDKSYRSRQAIRQRQRNLGLAAAMRGLIEISQEIYEV